MKSHLTSAAGDKECGVFMDDDFIIRTNLETLNVVMHYLWDAFYGNMLGYLDPLSQTPTLT